MKLYSFLLLLLLIPLIQSQEINLDHVFINSTICNDDYSYVYIFPLDKDNNTVKVDNIKIHSSINLTNATLVSGLETGYVFFIDNFTSLHPSIFNISINVSQSGFSIEEVKTYEIKSCHSFKENLYKKFNNLDDSFNKNFSNIAIIVIFLFLITVIWVILKR